MKVKELIEILRGFDPEQTVHTLKDTGEFEWEAEYDYAPLEPDDVGAGSPDGVYIG